MGRFDDAPEKYWHCYIKKKGDRSITRSHDMTKQELLERIVHPWQRGEPFVVDGNIVRNHDELEYTQITHTHQTADYYINSAQPIYWDIAVLQAGKDYSSDVLVPLLATVAPSNDVALLLQICKRLPHAAKVFERSRAGKNRFEISDEYDVQQLLYVIVRAYFKYSVNEEPIKKLANTKHTRADLALESLGVLIELKYVHDPGDQGRIVKELAEDLLHYEQWEHLRVFIYVIYNSDDLADPEALEKMSNTRKIGERQYDVHIVCA